MTKKNLLLISNSTNAGEVYLDWCKGMIADFCNRHNVKRVLFIPYAGVSVTYKDFPKGYDAYQAKVKDAFAAFGVEIYSIHKEADAKAAVAAAECIAVGGGNTFHLVYELYRNDVMSAIAKRAAEGVPYMGWSAGSNVACPSLMTTNDMPIIEPASFRCLNLVPFQINPHYTDFLDPKHGGETRMDRINEFLIVNPNMYVAGVREATALSLENGKLTLIGRNNPMIVLKHNQEPSEYNLNDDINFLLG